MAAPKSFVPKRPTRSAVKRFTLQQANSTLPLVRRVVADIVRVHARAAQTRQMIEDVTGKQVVEAEAELARQLEQLSEFTAELAAIGAELKDYEAGLIDFTGRHQGRDICLCWKLGEDQIAFWHEKDAGFAGRQPVSTLQET